jgi:predicted methyltransferase MtxX (methanogen marker protein 4)
MSAKEEIVMELDLDQVVFVQGIESRDIDALVRGTAEASAAVFEAILELEEWHGG